MNFIQMVTCFHVFPPKAVIIVIVSNMMLCFILNSNIWPQYQFICKERKTSFSSHQLAFFIVMLTLLSIPLSLSLSLSLPVRIDACGVHCELRMTYGIFPNLFPSNNQFMAEYHDFEKQLKNSIQQQQQQ